MISSWPSAKVSVYRETRAAMSLATKVALFSALVATIGLSVTVMSFFVGDTTVAIAITKGFEEMKSELRQSRDNAKHAQGPGGERYVRSAMGLKDVNDIVRVVEEADSVAQRDDLVRMLRQEFDRENSRYLGEGRDVRGCELFDYPGRQASESNDRMLWVLGTALDRVDPNWSGYAALR